MVTHYQLQMISIPINTDHYQLTAVVTVFGGVEHESYNQHNAFVDTTHLSTHPKPIISDQTVHLTCMKFSSVKDIFYIWAQINFYLHFIHI